MGKPLWQQAPNQCSLHSTAGAACPKQAPNQHSLHNAPRAVHPKQAPNQHGLHSTSGAACPNQAPNQHSLHNAPGAVHSEHTPNQRSPHSTSGAACPKQAPNQCTQYIWSCMPKTGTEPEVRVETGQNFIPECGWLRTTHHPSSRVLNITSPSSVLNTRTPP